MKRLLIPLITFAAAFAVLQLLLPYSLFAAERDSLFLLTPDYLHEVFSEPLPVTHLLGAFFAQFFYFPYAGAALCALPVAIVAGLLARCFRRRWLKVLPALVLLTGLVVFATNRKMRDGGSIVWNGAPSAAAGTTSCTSPRPVPQETTAR